MSISEDQNATTTDEVRDRAIGFFRLLRDFAQSRQTVVRQVDDYPDHLWFHEVPLSHDCFARGKAANDDQPEDVWIEVKHRPEPKCPVPPTTLKPWLKSSFPFGSNTEDEPELYDRIRVDIQDEQVHDQDDSGYEEHEPRYDELQDHPEIESAWDEYLLERWLPWTEVHQKWLSHHRVYARLFSIHQAQLREGERFELVLGLGCLAWLTPSEQRVARHVLTVPAVLEFDPNQGIFTVGPTRDGIKISLELDMLESDERPLQNLERDLSPTLSSLEEDLWDQENLDAVLRSIAKALDDRGEYQGVLGPMPPLERAPLVVFAPALVYRRRSARGMVVAFSKILEQLDGGGDIPPNIRKVAERSGESPGTQGDGSGEIPPLADAEVYFPLPSNPEQYSIIDKLRSNQGLLVQGPPGTGKTHTIANLICHLLATGKRVLVTAQTPQALSVLRKKVPKELQPLCVTVLGHDRESVSHLEASVRGIADRQSVWDEQLAQEDILRFEAKRDSLRQQLNLVDQALEQMRRSEIASHEVPGGSFQGTGTSIAQQMAKAEPSYGWLADDIGTDERPPLTSDELRELIQGLRSIDDTRSAECAQDVPDLGAIGTGPDQLIDLIGKERRFKDTKESLIASGAAPHYEAILRSNPTRAEIQRLDASLKALRRAIDAATNTTLIWTQRAVDDVLSDGEKPWKELYKVTQGKLFGLADRAKGLLGKQVSIPAECEHAKLQADASDLKAFLADGGSVGFLSKLFNATVKRTKYIRSTVSVEGRACSDIKSLETLIGWIELERTTDLLWNMWQGTAQREDGPLSLQIARLEEHLEALTEVLALEEILKSAKDAVSSLRELPSPEWRNAPSRDHLSNSCKAIIATILLQDVRDSIDKIAAHIRSTADKDNAHPSGQRLLDAIVRRAEDEIRQVASQIDTLSRDRDLHQRCQGLLDTLSTVAPKLATQLKNTCTDAHWDDRVLVFEAAWHWAQARSWLKDFVSGENTEDLLRRYERLRKDAADTVEQLAATKAWAQCIGRLSEKHRQHLVAWQQDIKRIGAGTGRHAERHRRAAQKNLAECQDAIPAWVMPLYRLYETIDPRPEMFDVVIVDEASQCGLDGLFVNYIGKQVIIVGDDEQISPTRITDHSSFRYLVNQFLPDYHLSSVLQPETSLFDLGEVWFAKRIVLREHFRCMPEIIRFSNDLCYANTPLIPLRQYPVDRLPPVKVVYVPNGCEHGNGQRKTNPLEAQTVVDTIVNCTQDPRYKGKTMGVISLLGERQARVIENELIERLGPEEIGKRKLLCGDAYTFQGDERDVMFLSLVVAPVNENGDRSLPRGITAKQFQQRYNVAASRACDQMWLFHSVTVDELRNPQDLRRKLLEHCINPAKRKEAIGGINIEELRYLAAQEQRPAGTQPPPFDSWFEVDVFLRVHDRGYRVVPQFPTLVGNYRIDLVIEGDKPKLALECYGDYWHGPDQFHADMARQRQLERAGWTFSIIRSSEFYENPDSALESLWRKLDDLGIHPTQDEPPSNDDDPSSAQPENTFETKASHGENASHTGTHTRPEAHVDEEDSFRRPPASSDQPTAQAGHGYVYWEPRQLPHPDESPLASIAAVLVEIVQAEGPMVDYRAFKLYARAAGIQRMRRGVRDKLARALEKARRDGLVERRKECGQVVVWCTGAPDVLVRARGDRTLQEVPPSEIAPHMHEFLKDNPNLTERMLFDRLRDRLAIGRLTQVTRIYLSKILNELVNARA